MNNPIHTNHVFLHPGEYVVATSACTIHTLLGSCVSMVLWHPEKRIGAMSHAIVPTRSSRRDEPLSGRYGDEVLRLMLNELERAGVDPRECRASIYGGSNVLLPLDGQPEWSSIGRKNGEMARDQLEAYGIPVVAESLFGNGYRTVRFNLANGDVRSKLINATDDTENDADIRVFSSLA